MRTKSELIKRYILFLLGLFVNAFGVALIIIASLGTSPVAVIPYVMNKATGISVGTYTFIVNMILLIIQIIILNKKFPLYQLLQIPVSFGFALFVDLCLSICGFLSSENYETQLCILILGCIVRALGVSIQVLADVVMLSGEAVVKAISTKFEKNFSVVKVIVDAAMVLIALLLSYILMGKIVGIREGTIIAVLLISPCSAFFTGKLYFIEKYLGNAADMANINEQPKQAESIIVTISSDYGSGGHKIGRIIANQLGYKLYDRNLANMVSKECGISKAYVRSHDEKLYHNWYERMFTEAVSIPGGKLDPYADLFEAQKSVMTRIVNDNCVIIGHCANYILKDCKRAIHIHIHSDLEHRVYRIMRDYKMSENSARSFLNRRDKARAAYYTHFTGENWKNFDNYHVTIDSGLLETEETADILLKIINRMKEKMNFT
ncbi:MAG: DUF6198 family protein [Coprococcus sp.]